MSTVAKLARWEWFKLRRRWLPWILLGFLLLFSQMAVWIGFFSYNSLRSSGGQVLVSDAAQAPDSRGQFRRVSCSTLRIDGSDALPADSSPDVMQGLLAQCQQQAEQQETLLQQGYDGFTLPGSLLAAFGIASSIGLILLTVLTASAIGSDYGLGTMRPILARGTGRLPYLTGKFLMLLAAALGALGVVGAVTVLSSLIAVGIAEAPPGVDAEPSDWSDAVAAFVRTWASFIPYIAFTGMVSVLTRSAAAGMAVGLGYYFAESLLGALLGGLFSWFSTVGDFLLIRNINALAGGFDIGSGGGSSGSDIGLVQAAAALIVYTVMLTGIAIRSFQKRDVAGAIG